MSRAAAYGEIPDKEQAFCVSLVYTKRNYNALDIVLRTYRINAINDKEAFGEAIMRIQEENDMKGYTLAVYTIVSLSEALETTTETVPESAKYGH